MDIMSDLQPSRLLGLSDEILLLIVQQLDRHDDIPRIRLTCHKFKGLSDNYMFRNLAISLQESVNNNSDWALKVQCVPPNITKTRHLTFLNQARVPGGVFYRNTICQPHSYRILRWHFLEENADLVARQLSKSAFLVGSLFHWNVALHQDQLSSFRWRHAVPISLGIIGSVLEKHAGSISNLEISMIRPPSAEDVERFDRTIADKTFPNLRSLSYNGLSHTEPIPANNPERGGRFRMLRPLFRKIYKNLDELVLSQDHCISQIGKTPLINGRTYNSFLCNFDELVYHAADNKSLKSIGEVKLSRLELGGFKLGTMFDVAPSIADNPRFRIHLPGLRRLVLNDCDELVPLLERLSTRREEIHLTELALRIQEDDDANESVKKVKDAIKSFIVSFKGLKLLSILWHGPHPPEERDISKALEHHCDSLQVYNYCARGVPDDDDPFFLRFASLPKITTPWVPVIANESNKPKLREVGLSCNFPNGEYDALRILSQFQELRTVHINNFPQLHSLHKGQHWKVGEGTVTPAGNEVAAKFAEFIALPFYSWPPSADKSAVKTEMDEWKLEKVADNHALQRDQELFGHGVRLPAKFNTSMSQSEALLTIFQQRAEVDAQFNQTLQAVRAGKETFDQVMDYENYKEQIQGSILGYTKPLSKPKLRLLIVGEWRYRDQMNTTGPRTWDPRAWSYNKTDKSDLAMFLADDHLDEDDDGIESGWPQQRLRHGFKKEWDVSLLPIFFKIDWVAERGSDKKWRWKAKATALEQMTLEGYGALGDVSMLDFAWLN